MENPKPDPSQPDSSEGQPLSAAGEGHTGEPEGSLDDQKKNMESEGQPVQPPVDAADLPATADDEAEREREAKLARDGSGF